MLKITKRVSIPESEIDLQPIRAQGPGGQHLNKSSTAIHLRFDSQTSSLPEYYKSRILSYPDRRINRAGVINIKAQRFRSQEQNRSDALVRLQILIGKAVRSPKSRAVITPPKRSKIKRLENKAHRARLKKLRQSVSHDD